MIDLFLYGGPLFMFPLFIASVGVIAVAIERTVHYRRAAVDPQTLTDEIEAAWEQGGLAAAREVAATTPGPLARVWSEGLNSPQLPASLMRERLEGVACEEIRRLEKHLSHLEVVAPVAPLIGILGTVAGMIIAFGGVAGGLSAGVGVDGERLTAGIAKALVTTGAGLGVAIPATIVHHYLRARVERFTEDLEQTMRDLFVTLAQRSAARRPAREATPVASR